MKKIRTLIVDDSVVYRSQIRAALDAYPWLEIQGVASNGRLALERIHQSLPDLLVLDLEMPEMDGIATLKEMSRLGVSTKVLVFSSASKRGASITLEALRLGASDFIPKPSGLGVPGQEMKSPEVVIRELMGPRLLALFPSYGAIPAARPRREAKGGGYASPVWSLFHPKVVVIGSSTGGPNALEKIFSGISGPLRCPILITQHMPPLFTTMLAERLSKVSGIACAEGKNGERVENRIYLAPGGFHMKIIGAGTEARIGLDEGALINSVRPAVDPLFESAVEHFGSSCLGIILTGMGSDGRVGAQAIKQAGGAVLIQSQESCVVYGMPGAVDEAGAYDRILSPEGITASLVEKCAEPAGDKQEAG